MKSTSGGGRNDPQLDSMGVMTKTATISECGKYRYSLTRSWMGAGPNEVFSETRALFIMLNPSTADAEQDDPTIRKCMGFARRWGHGGMTVVNLYAYRTPYPAELWERGRHGTDIIGPDNAQHIGLALETPFHTQVIPAWGASVTVPAASVLNVPAEDHAALVLDRIVAFKRTPMCLGKTQSDQPCHPLMLAYTTPLVPVGWVYSEARQALERGDFR